MTTRKFTVKNISFDSDLTNEGAIATCAALSSQFARDLARQYRQRQRLSDAQWAWVHKLALDSVKPVAPAVTLGDVQGILDLFDTASSRLKHPKIHLATQSGLEVCLSIAGPRSKAPGTVNVTDGGKFGQNVWYGRIRLDGTLEPSRACAQEIMDYLVEFAQDPARIAGEYGRRTGQCCFCNLKLTDARSLVVGYGPICARNWGDLPWGEALGLA